jgi:protein phosphatase
MHYRNSSFSDQGPHLENQDSLGIAIHSDWCLACIADGVGGAAHGRDAAQLATKFFIDTLKKNISIPLRKVIEAANAELLQPSGQGLVTTFSGVFIKGLNLQGVHAGDTRIYVLRGNGIKQLSEDHTEYFRFRKEGKLTVEDAATYPRKHVIENALGSYASPRIDCFDFTLEQGDRVLLTTDGVHTLLSKQELRDISKTSSTVVEFVARIEKHVQYAKPTDNYSVLAIEIA